MIINDKQYGEFDICLADDGTMDTVVEVCPSNQYIIDQIGTKEIRFSTEYGAHRDENGVMINFESLAKEALEAYIEQYLI